MSTSTMHSPPSEYMYRLRRQMAREDIQRRYDELAEQLVLTAKAWCRVGRIDLAVESLEVGAGALVALDARYESYAERVPTYLDDTVTLPRSLMDETTEAVAIANSGRWGGDRNVSPSAARWVPTRPAVAR